MAEIVACQWTNTIKLKARFIFFVMLLSLLTSLVAMAQEVVIIDAGAPDIPTLVDDVSRQSQAGRDIHVVILDGERDGVAQVTDILKTYHHLQAVHIVSHGGEGQIQLGNDWLDEAGLRRRAAAVASWGMSLAPGGDMLLYGCRLAGDERGRAFVEQLRRLTAVDVAASRDATGHASAGGDWSLDYRAGAIEAAQAFSRTLQAAYPHVLEGTREVSPTNTDYAMLKSAEISATLGSPWAYYNAPASRRLNFRIANPANETVYIGFSQQADAGLDNVAVNNPLYFRIVDPSGSVVYGPFMIEPTGFGTPAGGADGPYLPNIPFANVAGHAQASAGPNTISAAGYDVSDPDSNAATDNPWVFQPAAPGDYRIEFDANNVAGGSVAMAIRWFDITVADTSGASPVAINGRVWSPSWQFRTREPGGGTFAEPFNGSVFVYHDLHRFVTEVDFNGANFRGLTFQLAFNQDGPGISGNVAADRRSVNNTNSVDPVFPIFLNDPDSSEFPSGAIGVVSTPLGINDLASLDITVNVTQPGQVELILDFDDDGGFTPGRDRVFFQDVSAGDNAIAWDGLDGAGATINVNTFNGGSGIPAIVIYTQGATHLMAYDVEGLDNGFAINQTRPTTNLNVLQFWDDSNIPDDPNGAAPETKVNVDAGATPRQIWTNASYGDLNTINTWWFGNRVVRDTIVLPPEADLIITQVDSADPVNPGGTLTYTITVTNNGPDNATNVVATDTLPAGVTLVSTSGCSEDPAGAPTCTLGDIAASSSAQYTITVTIDAGASGVIMNTASVASDTMDPNAANNSSSENTTVNAPPVAVNDSALTQLNTPVTLSVTGNDSDSDGVIDTATVDLDPSTGGQQSTFVVAGEGTFSDDGSGNVTFTPAPGFTGSSSISYTVNDNNGGVSNAATITVTVNAPPVAVNDSALTQLNTPVTLSVTGNDSDSDGVIDTATVDLDPSTGGQQSTFVVAGEGTFSDDGSGNVTFTPAPGFTGSSSISYTVNDNDGGVSNAATITVTVNAPPVAVNDSALTQLNTPVTLSVTGNDSDSDGAIDTATVDLDPSTGGQQSTFVVAGEGTFSDDGSGNVTFTPAPGFTGSSSISYTVNDNDGATSNAATITVTVNAPPVAVNDSALTQLNTPVTLSVTGNDSDSDGVIGAATVDLDPSTGGQQSTFVVAGEGTFSDDGSGNVTFTPEVGFTGVSTISYTVNDNDGGLSNAATISVRVNDPPVAVNDSVVTPVNRAVTLSVIANDSDSDGVIDAATVDLDPSTAGQQSTFVVAGEGTFSDDGSGNVTFTPEAGFTGVSTIPYTVNDNDGGASNTAAIAVTVQPGPAANDDAVVTSLDTPVTFDITVNDIASANPLDPSSVDLDPATPGQQTTFAVASQGTFSVDALGNVTFTPETGFTGTVDISYTIEDIVGGVSNAAAIRVRVNAPPTAGDDSAVTPVDTPVTLSVIANDADTDGSIDAASVDLDPATAGRQTTFAIAGEGVFSVDDAGNATFTPELGFTGVSSASYTVNDNDGDASNAAAIDITVLAGPAANDDSASTQMDVAVTFDILANDVGGGSSIDPTTVDLDPSAAGQQNSLVAAGEGTFSVDAAGNVTFTPEAGFTGASSVTYVVDDALGSTSNVATITVTVNAPPTAVDDSALTPHNTPVTVSVVANDNDSDGSIDPASVDLDPAAAGQQTTFSVAGEGVYSVDGSGQVTFTPEANFVGVSTISYAVNDNDGAVSNLASIQVTVLNSGPLANDDTAHTPAGTPVAIPVLANDNDPDGDVLSLTLTPVTAPSNGVVTLLADGNVIYTPDAGFSGVDAFVYEVCDGFGACDTAQVAVTVSATDADNMPPTAVADNSHTLQDTPVDVIVLPNDVDPEGQLLTVTSPANPATTQGGVFSVTNNIITYTPPAGFTGVDTFVYEVCDVAGACDTAIVTVAVRPAGSDPVPTAVGDGAATQQGTAVAVDVLANDTHPTNDALTIAAFTDGAHGVVTLDDGGTPNDPSDDQLIYTPDAGFTGRDVFTYTVTDANGDAAIAAVSVTVGAVGEANIFDPPLGIKIINPAGFPELVWRMVWINNGNATANAARITDRIPDGTTYVPDSVQCEARGATTVTLCAFDADANQVVYEGSIAPDLGALTEEEADNELIFSFRAAVPPDFFGAVENQAEAHWDADGDGDIDDDIAGGQSPVVTDDPNTNDPGDVTATVFPPPPGVCLFQFQPVVLAAESAEADLDDHEDFHSDLVGVGARQQAALPLSLSTPLDGHVVAGSSVAVAALPGPSVDVTLSEPITVSVANDDVDALPDIIEADGVKVEALAAMADHIVVNRDGLAVILPAEVLESDATLEITTLSASQLPLPLPGQGAAGFYHLALSTGQTQLDAPVTLRFPYPDADENGLVDGSGVDEGLLTLWRYDAEAAQWRHLEPAWVIAERNVVSASTDQLGLVGLFRAADNRPATLALPSDDVVAFGAALSAVDASAASDGWFRIAQVAQMPYVAAWDTTAVADGDYRLRVACAQDAEALSAFESATAALGGGDSNSSNCFIATAAFDTPLAPQVQVLRDFRDAYLMRSAIGRWLVSQYYRLSPPLANIIRRHDGLRAATRVALTPLVWTAQLAPWAHGGLLAAGLLLALTGACSLGYWRWRQRRSY